MRTNRLAYLVVCVAALLVVTGCSKQRKGKNNSTGNDNCLVAEACCALAEQEGADEPLNGADGCQGEDIDTTGEWCDKAAELAKKALNAESVEGSCVLGLKANTVTRVPVLWVNSTDENKIAKFDSVSGEEVFRVTTWGQFPNRTAVANDGSVWITNRNSYQYIHIGEDGTPICASTYGGYVAPTELDPVGSGTGYTRGAAIDSDGNAWIGFYSERAAVQVSSTEVETEMVTLVNPSDAAEMMEVPLCKELKRLHFVNAAPYGFAADGDGHVWLGTLSATWLAKIDARTGDFTEFDFSTDPKYALPAPDGLASYAPLYGMSIDLEGNPWYGNAGGNYIFKVNQKTMKIDVVARSPLLGDPALGTAMPLTSARSLGIDKDGHLWVADNSYPYAHEFDTDGTWLQAVHATCPDTVTDGAGLLGIGSDIDGNMWMSMQTTGRVIKFTTEGTVIGCYPEPDPTNLDGYMGLLHGPYTYADMTGSSNSLVASQLGRWRGIVSQDDKVQWSAIAFQGAIPDGTSVCFRLRAADTEADLKDETFSTDVCVDPTKMVGPFFILDLLNGGDDPIVEKSKFMEMELKLASADEAVTPTVRNLSVAAFK